MLHTIAGYAVYYIIYLGLTTHMHLIKHQACCKYMTENEAYGGIKQNRNYIKRTKHMVGCLVITGYK